MSKRWAKRPLRIHGTNDPSSFVWTARTSRSSTIWPNWGPESLSSGNRDRSLLERLICLLYHLNLSSGPVVELFEQQIDDAMAEVEFWTI